MAESIIQTGEATVYSSADLNPSLQGLVIRGATRKKYSVRPDWADIPGRAATMGANTVHVYEEELKDYYTGGTCEKGGSTMCHRCGRTCSWNAWGYDVPI